MHALQSFSIVMLCALVWITIILGLIFAEEITIYDGKYWVEERVRDGNTFAQGFEDQRSC